MNIVICDDNPLILKEIRKIINPIILEDYPQAKIIDFKSGNDLLTWTILNDSFIDILFIDVEMPGYSGIDVIEKLRNIGYNCFIVFISCYEEYVYTALDFDISHYLVKPLDPDKLVAVTRKIINQHKSKYCHIEIIINTKHIFLSVKDIILIESNFGKLTYHTLDEKYTVPGKITELEKKLVPFNFLRTHKSYLINMSSVIYYEGYYFYLINGLVAEISHVKRATIINKYQKYFEKSSIH